MSDTTTISIDDLDDPEEGAVWRRMPRTRGIRRRLKLTPEQFAERFGIPADMVRAWEAGTAKPDAVAEAYLRVIAREPEVVAAALATGGVKEAAE